MGAARRTKSGKATAHSKLCCAPIEPPVTRARLATPKVSVSSLCWARTSSPIRTLGKLAMACGPATLCGEVDRPLPIWLTMTMKYLLGSSARPSPT
jgi:hypothetical protein